MTASPPTAIRVRLFAGLRESAGWGEQTWMPPGETAADPAAPCTPRQVWAALQLPGSLETTRVAINQQFAGADSPLQGGDELAFLPPISGG
ncbi:MAG: MoaD/ThiS family protein [Vulcanococcus sp.]